MKIPCLVAVFSAFDGTGGAGVLADCRAITAAGAMPFCVLTAVTAQNLDGVRDCWHLSTAQVQSQYDALQSAPARAVKIGVCGGDGAMVATDGAKHWQAPVVWDPVLAPTSGKTFVDAAAQRRLCRLLLPLTTIITPNRQELAALSGRRKPAEGARVLLAAGASFVLATDLDGGEYTHHVLYDSNGQTAWEATASRRRGEYHGTGCFFSASLATRLALGDTPAAAADFAHRQTLAMIDESRALPFLGRQKLFCPQD